MRSLLYTLVIFSVLSVVVWGESYNITVKPFSGEGVCSQGNVTEFSFDAKCSDPGATVILAANKPSYDALKTANLSDPSSANLPAPLLDLSCVTANITTCSKTFPANRKLRPQQMCLLFKNDNKDSLQCTLNVKFTYDTGSSPSPGPNQPPSSSAMSVQAPFWTMIIGVVVALLC